MRKKRVFVSFDFDNDKKLKDFIIGQARNSDSPFEITDHSLKEAAPERDWEQKAEAAIRRSQIVLVMVGPHTAKARGVLKEVDMARRNDVPIVQVIGYRDGDYAAVPNAGRLYRWNWENLKKLLVPYFIPFCTCRERPPCRSANCSERHGERSLQQNQAK